MYVYSFFIQTEKNPDYFEITLHTNEGINIYLSFHQFL